MTTEIWPDAGDTTAAEPTPLFQKIITQEEITVPLLTPDEDANVPRTPDAGDVDPQAPGTITGYRKHTQQQIDVVNSTKAFENDLGRWMKQMAADLPKEHLDPRWVAVARTHFQQGFMALNRAVFQPDSEL